VRAFWRSVERYPAGANLFNDRSAGMKQAIILSGWACEMRILPDGRRQIFSFCLPGDPIEIHPMSNLGARGLVALTRLELVDAQSVAVANLEAREAVMGAIAEARQRKEDRLFDHMVRIGRLTARERVLHLLIELYDRLDAVGLVRNDGFRLPLTQEVVADALGLSIVHINRTLQQLRQDGSIGLKGGSVTLNNIGRLATLACYQPARQIVDERLRDLVA
jgi:CRP-like cAMP-binding protein